MKAPRPKLAVSEWKPHPLMQFYRDHQIDVPLLLILIITTGTYLSPDSIFGQFVYPQYRLGEVDSYGKGLLDLAFVAYYVVVWTFARAACIKYLIQPVGRKLGCKQGLIDRFGEQGWLVMYYTPSFLYGFNLLYTSPYYNDYKQFWIDYPNHRLASHFKAYYLIQLAFWIQQFFVLNIEKPRSDYLQYLVHHIITCSLIISSYITNYFRIGHSVLVAMDVADIFLCSAKCFNYLNWRLCCDSIFAAFVFIWVYSRHYVYNKLVYNVYTDYMRYLPIKWDPANGYFATYTSYCFFLFLLISLQIILILWFFMIMRVLVRVISGNIVADERSDEDDNGAEGDGKSSSKKD